MVYAAATFVKCSIKPSIGYHNIWANRYRSGCSPLGGNHCETELLSCSNMNEGMLGIATPTIGTKRHTIFFMYSSSNGAKPQYEYQMIGLFIMVLFLVNIEYVSIYHISLLCSLYILVFFMCNCPSGSEETMKNMGKTTISQSQKLINR